MLWNKMELEDAVVVVRLSLYNRGFLYGARAIRRKLENMRVKPLPSQSAINRILKRHGLTNGRTGYYAEDMEKFS